MYSCLARVRNIPIQRERSLPSQHGAIIISNIIILSGSVRRVPISG